MGDGATTLAMADGDGATITFLPDDILQRIGATVGADLAGGATALAALASSSVRLRALLSSAAFVSSLGTPHGVRDLSSLEGLAVLETVTGLGNNRVYFRDAQCSFRPASSIERLNEYEAMLWRHPSLLLRVEGHTGSRAPYLAARGFSHQRTAAVGGYLLQRAQARRRCTAAPRVSAEGEAGSGTDGRGEPEGDYAEGGVAEAGKLDTQRAESGVPAAVAMAQAGAAAGGAAGDGLDVSAHNASAGACACATSADEDMCELGATYASEVAHRILLRAWGKSVAVVAGWSVGGIESRHAEVYFEMGGVEIPPRHDYYQAAVAQSVRAGEGPPETVSLAALRQADAGERLALGMGALVL
jgi:hypothetical protein